MTPTLAGRLQTRFALLALVGGLITLLLTPLLPVDGTLGARYRTTFTVLLLVAVVGIAWELLYTLLQQFRWEKDWPTLFGLVTGVPEGLLAFGLLRSGEVPGVSGVDGAAFLIHFSLVWISVWLFANGPMRLFNVRWRYNGGRLV